MSGAFNLKYLRRFYIFKLFYVDNITSFTKIRPMIVDMEIKAAAEDISRRAGYLWRFL